MSLTAEQANALLGSITTREQLRDLINQLDIHSSGSITVLYSGYTANGLDNSQIIQGMLHNGDDIRVIDTTEAARFLNVDPTTPNWNKPLYQKLEQIIGGKPDKWGYPRQPIPVWRKSRRWHTSSEWGLGHDLRPLCE